MSTTNETPELIGIGSPLVDMVLEVPENFLADKVTGEKGGMELTSIEEINNIIKEAEGQPEVAIGGAASNTTNGCANLGVSTAFIGSIGKDELGTFYKTKLIEQGCEPRLLEHESEATGRVLSLVTPDAERTMRTCLAAAAGLTPEQITPELFAGSKIVMLEGYTLFNPDLTIAIAKATKAAGCKLALDMASFEVVNASKDVLTELFSGMVDIVFANEDEATAWNENGIEDALEDLGNRCEIAVVKIGKDGSLIRKDNETTKVEAIEAKAIDTTGAGDNWAAGFLAGYLQGLPLSECGRLGTMAGAAAVSVIGAQLPNNEWQKIKGSLDAWKS